jgi:Na+/proline symporter
MGFFTATIVISIVVYVAIVNYAVRRIRKLDDYYVAVRSAPTLLIVAP